MPSQQRADTMIIIERMFAQDASTLFRAWTEPDQMARWRGSPGWHVETDGLVSELRPGGRHHHVKVRDDDPSVRVTTDAMFTEFFDPDVFVARQRITGDSGIDPNESLELRVEFTAMGGDSTLVRIVQGPYDPAVAQYHAAGWEKELARLGTYLDGGQA